MERPRLPPALRDEREQHGESRRHRARQSNLKVVLHRRRRSPDLEGPLIVFVGLPTPT